MEINNLKINLPKIGSKGVQNKPLANLNEPIKDSFVRTTSQEEKTSNKPNFRIEDMSAIYVMRADRNEPDFEKKVINACEKLPKDLVFSEFEQDPFNPINEFTIKAKPLEKQGLDDEGFEPLAKKFKFDANNLDIVEKTSRKIKRGTLNSTLFTKTVDYKNNTTVDLVEDIDNQKEIKTIKKQTITTKDNNGNVVKTEIMTPSEIKGMYDIEVVYPDGKKEQVAKTSFNPKTGITTIKKDMVSDDGTRTNFLYEDDKNGNRLIDYKITDKDGKVLMNNSQTFEVLDENHFVSSKNSYKYDIKVDKQKLTVKNLNNEREVSIDFRKKCKGNRGELINLLKKVPGEELFETVDCINKMNGKDKDKVLESFYNHQSRNINVGDDLMVFLHELGHAKDYAINDDKKECIYSRNEDIQKIYMEECENFNEKHSSIERNHIDYFSQMRGHYGGEWGGLEEVVAETNALTNTYTDENVECCGPRTQYLQQYFPKTIAKINEEMRWKDDQFAIEFYGT